MKQFWATLYKDLLLLSRDRAGLLVLFLMPAVLVLVVSLVQNNILETTGAGGLKILFVDQEGGATAGKIRTRLSAIPSLQIVDSVEGEPLSTESARLLVNEGEYQFGILVPEGAGEAMKERARLLVRELLRGKPEGERHMDSPVLIFYDPTVQGIFRTAVQSALGKVMVTLEAEEKARELAKAINTIVTVKSGGFMAGSSLLGGEDLALMMTADSLLGVVEDAGADQPEFVMPNAVQQNVPAWALFGMFFIVVPLSGALLRERQDGTLQRLRTLPVSYSVLLMGKVSAFVTVCMVQFTLMLLVGKYILPLLGTPDLDLQGRLLASYLLAFCAALAAAGYGLLIGTLARSYEQASMFGAVSVVIAAALGGVMVPVYVMPEVMQTISTLSPLAWGLEGFLDIFVRGGEVGRIKGNLISLVAFFGTTSIFSWYLFLRDSRAGRA